MATEKKQTGGDFVDEKKKPAKKSAAKGSAGKKSSAKKKEANPAGDEQNQKGWMCCAFRRGKKQTMISFWR